MKAVISKIFTPALLSACVCLAVAPACDDADEGAATMDDDTLDDSGDDAADDAPDDSADDSSDGDPSDDTSQDDADSDTDNDEPDDGASADDSEGTTDGGNAQTQLRDAGMMPDSAVGADSGSCQANQSCSDAGQVAPIAECAALNQACVDKPCCAGSVCDGEASICLAGGNICELPLETGPCRALFMAFGFNTDSGECEQFVYGGCGGNANRFETKAACEQACGP